VVTKCNEKNCSIPQKSFLRLEKVSGNIFSERVLLLGVAGETEGKAEALIKVGQPSRLAAGAPRRERVRRDALPTVGQPSRLAGGVPQRERVRRDALPTVGQPVPACCWGAAAGEGKAGRFIA
jgi:hypothetical protein